MALTVYFKRNVKKNNICSANKKDDSDKQCKHFHILSMFYAAYKMIMFAVSP